MNEKKGSVIGGMLLIAGSCIGAGMLGLPIVTGLSGFFPSMSMMFLAWIFMTSTALLLVEVYGWFTKKVNLMSMVSHSLGKGGQLVCLTTYLFLFYALLVAYISGIGNLTNTFFRLTFNINAPGWIGSTFFVLLFGYIVYKGTRKVDICNRGLMFAKIGFFLLLLLIGSHFVRTGLLHRTNAVYAPAALPILVIAFGFHNMIPSLAGYLNGDLKRVRMTIIGGSLMALVIYLIWEFFVLGIVPMGGPNGLVASLKNDREASQSIASILRSPWVRIFSQGLAFFAILTSFLAQALSLVHFLADGFKIEYKKQENLGLCVLALLPPLILAIIYPQLFFKALNFAGGICAVILFGILPVLMVWVGRYRRMTSSSYEMSGGKPALIAILLFAVSILFLQVSTMAGAKYIPNPKYASSSLEQAPPDASHVSAQD